MLSDLRESGAIEAEADLVMFIYREAYYKRKEATTEGAEPETDPATGDEKIEEAEIIIAKQRNGPTGTARVGFIPMHTRFVNMDRQHRYEGE